MIFKYAIGVLGFTSIYTYFRYVVFKGVEMDHWPLFLMNKSISWAAVIFIGSSLLAGVLRRFSNGRWEFLFGARKNIGLMGAFLAVIHVLLSFMILNPSYFPAFFKENGMFNMQIELSLFFGSMAFLILLVAGVVSLPSMKESLGEEWGVQLPRLVCFSFACLFLHVLPMGWLNWFTPGKWPGYLPPISLLSCTWMLMVLALRRLLALRNPALNLTVLHPCFLNRLRGQEGQFYEKKGGIPMIPGGFQRIFNEVD